MLREYKPIHVLLFLTGILLILTLFGFFIPEKGLKMGGVEIHFMTEKEFLNPVKQHKKDISRVIAKKTIDDSVTNSNSVSKTHTGIEAPNAKPLNRESETCIQFSNGNKENLYKLFGKLQDLAESKNKIHVLHYGDSQIEGDRMTSYIRQRLQDQFGGNGPGMIPATNVYNTFTFKQRYSPNFIRYTCFGGNKLKNKRYGVMGSAARFTAEYDSTQSINETRLNEAWIEIEPAHAKYARARDYNTVTMYYNSCYVPCYLKIYNNSKLIYDDSLETDGRAHTVTLTFPKTPGKLNYQFTAKTSPTITGFSLEGEYGVQVSNIGMRGSSGTIFNAMDKSLLQKMYSDLNAELFIMQFGGNSVPFFKDSSSVRNYTSYFKSQLFTLKKLRPSATIIVIGPSDMSKLENGVFVSYPLLPYCVNQLKKVSLEAGAGFWDLFQAMGGINSMPSWVEQGLAGSDYIHFSNRGASIASELFFEAFGAEYSKWQEKNQQ